MNTMSEMIFRILFSVLRVLYFWQRKHYQKKIKGVGSYVIFNEKQEKLFFRTVSVYEALDVQFLLPDQVWLPVPVGLVYLDTLTLMYAAGEKMMADRFGDEYRQYLEKIVRFVPRFSG